MSLSESYLRKHLDTRKSVSVTLSTKTCSNFKGHLLAHLTKKPSTVCFLGVQCPGNLFLFISWFCFSPRCFLLPAGSPEGVRKMTTPSSRLTSHLLRNPQRKRGPYTLVPEAPASHPCLSSQSHTLCGQENDLASDPPLPF